MSAPVPGGRAGTVVAYDDVAGYGVVRDAAGERWTFHCTAITDGSRSIAVDTAVWFRLAAGHLGHYEAVDLAPTAAPPSQASPDSAVA